MNGETMETVAPVGTIARRARFREALQGIASRASADDLIRWMLIPASVLIIVGFNFMIFGWIGASKTIRQIEQIPYLISGGLIGLAMVILGGLLLASTFWVMVVRKLQDETEARTRAHIELLEQRLAEAQARRPPIKKT
jgi:hypothetical protein